MPRYRQVQCRFRLLFRDGGPPGCQRHHDLQDVEHASAVPANLKVRDPLPAPYFAHHGRPNIWTAWNFEATKTESIYAMHRGCQEAIARRAAEDAGTATANRKLARRYHPFTIFPRVSTKRLIVKLLTYFDGKQLRTALLGEG
ncbi:hypothetical protein PspLS_03949 [Pyricularia sp. CBS 133598]|nr:hypothetical protein PspLS_03949 [Pyricularia sp. CBS 133598]